MIDLIRGKSLEIPGTSRRPVLGLNSGDATPPSPGPPKIPNSSKRIFGGLAPA